MEFEAIPDRTTLSLRYPCLYDTVQAFIVSLGRWVKAFAPAFESQILIEDVTLFKTHGPDWHQSDRKIHHNLENLRILKTEASWDKSAYYGWVYGYCLHLSCNLSGFPKLVQVETTSVDESQFVDQKREALYAMHPSDWR